MFYRTLTKKGKKKGKKVSIDDDPDSSYGYGRRPTPDGRNSPDNYYDESLQYGRVPATRLPPLEEATKKKKKKMTVSYEAGF